MHTHYFLYTVACHEDEASLCELELRQLFGLSGLRQPLAHAALSSAVDLPVNRSPFTKERIAVLAEADSPEDLAREVASLPLSDLRYKVHYVKTASAAGHERLNYEEQLAALRTISAAAAGQADLHDPEIRYGITAWEGRWLFGLFAKNDALWQRHMDKPQNYSIALSTRVARAVANIAAPRPEGLRVIDPCCGIGTVLIEASSMGIVIEGRDINPITVQGARANLAHFGYDVPVALGDIAAITAHYDTAIVDLPYNHVSRLADDRLASILTHARRIADRAVILTVAALDERLQAVGFTVIDRGFVKKGSFVRQVLVCE